MLSDEDVSLPQNLLISVAFGLISLLVSAFNMSLFYFLIPGWRENHHGFYTLPGMLFVIINIGSISLANYGFVLYLSGDEFDLTGYLGILLITFVIGLLPIILIRQMENNKRLREKVDRKKAIEEHLGLESKSSLSLRVEDVYRDQWQQQILYKNF